MRCMHRMKSKPTVALHPPRSADSRAPELPVWKAFVVQFSHEARRQAGIFAGRIEHISSGRRARFGSPEELIASLWKMLDELGEK